MAAKIKKNDLVQVLAGRSKGQTGVVTRVLHDKNSVYVSGVNMVKKHVKPNPQAGIQAGIREQEAPIHISNVAIIDPQTKRPTRVGFKTVEGKDGRLKKVRYLKSSGEVIDI